MRDLEAWLPHTQSDSEEALTAAQAAMDAGAFDTAWTAGRSLSPQAAVTRGLQAIRISEQQMFV